jgi:hypothetical protein
LRLNPYEETWNDINQQKSLKDLLDVSSIIRSRAKKVKEAFNRLIQDSWVLLPTRPTISTYFPTYT